MFVLWIYSLNVSMFRGKLFIMTIKSAFLRLGYVKPTLLFFGWKSGVLLRNNCVALGWCVVLWCHHGVLSYWCVFFLL